MTAVAGRRPQPPGRPVPPPLLQVTVQSGCAAFFDLIHLSFPFSPTQQPNLSPDVFCYHVLTRRSARTQKRKKTKAEKNPTRTLKSCPLPGWERRNGAFSPRVFRVCAGIRPSGRAGATLERGAGVAPALYNAGRLQPLSNALQPSGPM